MKFVYTGHCASGFVQFTNPKANDETVVFPEGEAVEAPAWIAGKLANNSHFEAVKEAEADPADGETREVDQQTIYLTGKPRGKPGPKPKPKTDEP